MKLLMMMSLVFLASACAPSQNGDGPILTAEAAIAKAKSSWASVYVKTHSETFSEKTVQRFEPYTAVLADGVWTVRGTVPPDLHDTVPEATVRQADGGTSVHGVKR
jgi:hypothetical protein